MNLTQNDILPHQRKYNGAVILEPQYAYNLNADFNSYSFFDISSFFFFFFFFFFCFTLGHSGSLRAEEEESVKEGLNLTSVFSPRQMQG